MAGIDSSIPLQVRTPEHRSFAESQRQALENAILEQQLQMMRQGASTVKSEGGQASRQPSEEPTNTPVEANRDPFANFIPDSDVGNPARGSVVGEDVTGELWNALDRRGKLAYVMGIQAVSLFGEDYQIQAFAPDGFMPEIAVRLMDAIYDDPRNAGIEARRVLSVAAMVFSGTPWSAAEEELTYWRTLFNQE